MRFVEYCDLGDAPEFRVEAVGSIALVSPNIVRVSYLARRPESKYYGAIAHHFWDVEHYRDTIRMCGDILAALARERSQRGASLDLSAGRIN